MVEGEKKGNVIKFTIVGDGACGKTCLITSYTSDEFQSDYTATVYESYTATIPINDKPIELNLVDTAGQDGYDRFRALAYPQTDVFLICFSVVDIPSFQNAKGKWLNEIKENASNAPCFLVGTKTDLREEYTSQQIISFDAGKQGAQELHFENYIECSALTQDGLKEVFDEAIRVVLERQQKPQIRKRKKGICKIL